MGIQNSRYRIPDFLSVEVRFGIPIVCWIPDPLICIPDSKPKISDSTSKSFPDSGIPYMGQFLACMFCFSISDHVMLPQRTDSLKCRPIQVHLDA